MADNETDERRKIDRAVRAKALLSDVLVVGAFAAVEGELMAIWRGSAASADRDQVWYLITALERVKDNLEAVIRDGQISRAVLANLLKRIAA